MRMLKRIAAPWVLVTALACAGPVLAADPTVDQVYQAARAGHLDEAQQLMNQVLRDHPSSAKAHYVEAEISARAANFPRAREELAKAQQLDPSGSFAKPESLAALQRELARGNTGPRPGTYATYPRAQEHHSGMGAWPIILLVVAGGVIVWALSRRTRYYPMGGVPPAGPMGGGYGGGGYGPPPGYGPGGYGPPMGGGGIGSGIVGGLASGLALGAGVAAGEELVHHWIDKDGNRVEGPPPPGYVPPPQDDNANMGGDDFGVSDNGGSWDDNSSGGDSGGGGGGGDDWT